jgi:hypothetical protein
MNDEIIHGMTFGAVATAFIVAAAIFYRFWKKTGDRLFAWFALSFAVLGANRIASAVALGHGYEGDSFYWIRFAAFAVILIAILDKNRAAVRV